jgi:hypothetical protein
MLLACVKYVMKQDANLVYIGQLNMALHSETKVIFHIYLVNITPKFKKFQFLCIIQLNVCATYIFCMMNYLQNS